VQGHRQEHVELGQRPGREASGEESRERELSAILSACTSLSHEIRSATVRAWRRSAGDG